MDRSAVWSVYYLRWFSYAVDPNQGKRNSKEGW